ncbi:hypothetical protein LCGC14_0703610 [marine sediment metagenome]|uniref:Uncharacterized protein n=1 Tax=marine sediment metagenome TaxID=412755 RepID=A0A0F9QH50_9ZZZZ
MSKQILWISILSVDFDREIHLSRRFHNDKISLGRASEIAGISIWEMLDELKKKNVTLDYKISEAELEFEKILKKHNKK